MGMAWESGEKRRARVHKDADALFPAEVLSTISSSRTARDALILRATSILTPLGLARKKYTLLATENLPKWRSPTSGSK